MRRPVVIAGAAAGVGLMALGLALIYLPAALVVTGGVLLAISLRVEIR